MAARPTRGTARKPVTRKCGDVTHDRDASPRAGIKQTCDSRERPALPGVGCCWEIPVATRETRLDRASACRGVFFLRTTKSRLDLLAYEAHEWQAWEIVRTTNKHKFPLLT